MRARRVTPRERYNALRTELSHKENDTFEAVVGKHGVAITDLIRAFKLEQKMTYAHVFFVLTNLNAAWIRLICAPDDSYDLSTSQRYARIVNGLISDFTKTLVSDVITNTAVKPDATTKLSNFFVAVGDGTDGVRRDLRTYVSYAMDTARLRDVDDDAFFIASNNTVVAGMTLGSLLDQVC